MEKEIWKDIQGYEGYYMVSNRGNVKSLSRIKRNGRGYRTIPERILKAQDNGTGYLQVNLWKDGKMKHYTIHRLVAEAFIPNTDNLPQVNHIDENKENNHVDNLEWVTCKENINHGTHNEKVAEKLRGRKQSEESNKKRAEKMRGRKKSEETIKKLSKPVIAIDKITGLILEFPSSYEAERETGIAYQSIGACCKGKRNSAGGFYWMYVQK